MPSDELLVLSPLKTEINSSLQRSVDDAIRAAEFLKHPLSLQFITAAAEMIAAAFAEGNKILIAGNGGSLCDAMHFAEELSGQFRRPRKALPAIAIGDASHITCVANDFGFEHIFSRGVEAYGKPGDVFIGLTTSGNSANIINAVAMAKKMGLQTICFLGKTGGQLASQADLEWIVSGFKYSDRIQEAHMAAIHIIIELVEKILFDVT